MKIAEFVRDAPPGELEAIKKDIEVYTNGNKSVAADVEDAVIDHGIATLRPVQLNGSYTVLSKYNHVSGDEFFSDGVTFKVEAGKVTETGSHAKPSSECRDLQSDLDAYIADHYEAKTTVGKVFDAGSKLAVVISGRKLSPQNYFNGAWAATYEVAKSGQVEGEINVDVHYFEDGNVRLKSSTKVSLDAKLVDVIKQIAHAESEYEVSLNRALVNINNNEFKALRRQLPVTRSYMDWGQAATYRLGRDLENRD